MFNSLNALRQHITEIENIIGYSFNDKEKLMLAFTHSSFANEIKTQRLKSNERLEFLGDAVLNVVISENIYNKYWNLAEGEMTKARAKVVCEPSLVMCANKLGVGRYLLLGKGEELSGGRTRSSILSDAVEAIIAAIYLDGGLECAREFVLCQMHNIIEEALKGMISMDYKTKLQETVMRESERKIVYELVEEKGPPHNKAFITQVKIADTVMGIGNGKTKKESEQNAAKNALEKRRRM